MEDKLKITVIATGFESRFGESYERPNAESDWNRVSENEVFDRRLADTSESEEDADILNVPAFLRHQMGG